jgi:hypothetical protein
MKPQNVVRLILLAWIFTLAPAVPGGFTFTTNDGTITITGYSGNAGGYLIIPDTTNGWLVTTIGTNAFYARSDVTNVLISTNVTRIAYRAFYNCKLTSLTIPNSVTNIERVAFANCSFTNVVLPSSVISLGTSAFGICFHLAAIMVDELNPMYSSTNGVLFNKNQTTLLQIPGGRSGSYTIPDTVTSIGDEAFMACYSLTNVAIPNSVTNIGTYAFSPCGLTSIVIPDSVINIGVAAFDLCQRLAYVALGSGVRSLPSNAFSSDSALTNITIPKTVTNIGNSAFLWCSNLKGMFFGGNAPGLGLTAFYGDNNLTIYCLPGTTGWNMTYGYGGCAIALWNPQPQAIGIQTNGFGFTVVGTTNIPIVVESCADLPSGTWTATQTCTLTNGSIYFSDPNCTNLPTRFYRIRSP